MKWKWLSEFYVRRQIWTPLVPEWLGTLEWEKYDLFLFALLILENIEIGQYPSYIWCEKHIKNISQTSDASNQTNGDYASGTNGRALWYTFFFFRIWNNLSLKLNLNQFNETPTEYPENNNLKDQSTFPMRYATIDSLIRYH